MFDYGTKVLIKNLFSWLEDCIFEVDRIMFIKSFVSSTGIWVTHRKHVQNLESSSAHGPYGVCIVQLYTLK